MRPITYCVGDWIEVKTSKDGTIIFDVDFNDQRYFSFLIKYFEVIAKTDEDYILEVSYLVDDAFTLNKAAITKYNIDPRFSHCYAYTIKFNAAGKRRPHKSLNCEFCKEEFIYADPNYGKYLICWSCRNDPRNSFKLEEFEKEKL